MVTARCFWALIKFMATYLLAFMIAYLLAHDMHVVSYVRPSCVLSKIFSYAFFLRQRFASCLHMFCYSVDFLQLVPLQGITSSVLVNWLRAHIQLELCSDLLQGSCLSLFFFFFLLISS